jgi:hypothetical protein
MSTMNDESGMPVEVASASEVDQDGPVHDDSQALLDALSRRARRLGRHLRRTRSAPDRILKLMD